VTTSILALGPHDAAPVAASLEALPALLADPATLVWVDMIDPQSSDQKILEEVFRLHPTSVEDMLADAPTPKIERFESYIYVV